MMVVGIRAWLLGCMTLSIAAVAQPASTQGETDLGDSPAQRTRPVVQVIAGSCGNQETGEVVATLVPFTDPPKERVGSDRAAPGVTLSFLAIPLSLEQLQARPHAIAVRASGEQEETRLACGNLSEDLGQRGSLVISLPEEKDSGVTGFAHLVWNPFETHINIPLVVVKKQATTRDDDRASGNPGDPSIAQEQVTQTDDQGLQTQGNAEGNTLAAGTMATPAAGALATPDTVDGLGPLAYWRLDERSGTTAADIADGFAGTYGPGVGLNAPSSVPASNNAAAFFNGTGDAYVDMGDVLDFAGQEPFSLEAWFTPSSFRAGAYPRIAQKAGTDDEGLRQGYVLFANGDTGQVGFERWRDDAKESVLSTSPVPTERPAHIVATYDGGTMRLFVNGIEVASASSSLALPDTAFPFRIGNSTESASPFEGTIDEVAVYPTALDEQTVVAHFRAGMDLQPGAPGTPQATPVS